MSIDVLKSKRKSKKKHYEPVIIKIDGASKGNPGSASIGVVVFQGNKKEMFTKRIGRATNNVAEYTALIEALKYIRKKKLRNVIIFSDSKLVVEQVNGERKVIKMKPYYDEVMKLLDGLDVRIVHVPREEVAIADYAANRTYRRRIIGSVSPREK